MMEPSTRLVACSTGAISRWPDATGFDRIPRWCPQIDADAFEIMLYDAWYPELDTVIHKLRQANLAVVTVHADKDIPNALLENQRKALDLWTTNCSFADWGLSLRDRGYRGPLTLESPVVDANGDIDISRLNASLTRIRKLDTISSSQI